MVDDCDIDKLNQYKWRLNDKGYAITSKYISNNGKTGRQITIYMHRLIMNAQRGQNLDHADGDPLNNIRSNLRFCTHRQNCQNRKQFSKLKPYKGIYFCKKKKWWKTRIQVDGKPLYIGGSKDPKIAAEMYNKAAIRYFGEFAKLNFIGT